MKLKWKIRNRFTELERGRGGARGLAYIINRAKGKQRQNPTFTRAWGESIHAIRSVLQANAFIALINTPLPPFFSPTLSPSVTNLPWPSSTPLTHNISYSASLLYAPPFPVALLMMNELNLFLIFHVNVTTPSLILPMLIANNAILSYVSASSHLKTSSSHSVENSLINTLIKKKLPIYKKSN